PNPFNPETTINYSLPVDSHVVIEIYNIRGQKVKTLVDHSVEAGRHSVVWSGKNEHGISVSSGVYFTRMRTGKQSLIQKMLLLK
ncbi:MAG: T9SS type A sorting domain-containing protein, partial [Clostridiales bacterium]|nr:T9SS type A sorting domain-containing protein [Clostridiales bacterium]